MGVAVSGGGDSVALLKILLELKNELGIVLSVLHFHHGIRGVDADMDEAFVTELANQHALEVHLGRGSACDVAQRNKISIETAARELRRNFFLDLLQNEKVTRVATAHTLDDQAETVLMKVLRGAGTRGAAGVFPEQRHEKGSIVRPLLEIRRAELRNYLRSTNQSWREDTTNSDVSLTRNRVRTRVLPMLREHVNPSVDLALAHLGEIARADEEYWREHIARLLPLVTYRGVPTRGGGRTRTTDLAISFDIEKLRQQPLAVQRRLLLVGAEGLGCTLDFEHVQAILEGLANRSGRTGKEIEISGNCRFRLLFRELRIEKTGAKHSTPAEYRYRLSIPGEARIPELGTIIRARICGDNGGSKNAAYNRAHSIRLPQDSELLVRPWQPGDRLRTMHHASEKRVKELLYPLHLTIEEKRLWPVVLAGDRVVWLRGVLCPVLNTSSGETVVIEESAD